MTAPDFAAHRQRLLDRLAPDEAVIVFGRPHASQDAYLSSLRNLGGVFA